MNQRSSLIWKIRIFLLSALIFLASYDPSWSSFMAMCLAMLIGCLRLSLMILIHNWMKYNSLTVISTLKGYKTLICW